MRPTSVDPVKVILRTAGFSQNSLPMADEDDDGTTLNTPAGMPARSASTPMTIADSGVSAAGRATNAQPAASAGAALRVIIALGKFHGVMEAATPMGCLITVMRLSRWWPGMVSP